MSSAGADRFRRKRVRRRSGPPWRPTRSGLAASCDAEDPPVPADHAADRTLIETRFANTGAVRTPSGPRPAWAGPIQPRYGLWLDRTRYGLRLHDGSGYGDRAGQPAAQLVSAARCDRTRPGAPS